MGEKMIILPDGCTDFIFNLDDVRNLRIKIGLVLILYTVISWER